MSPGLVVLVLSLLLGIQPVTTDLYLPALPSLTEGFGAPVSHAQLTLTTLLLAFGISQLVWGPLSDRFGRRPVLLWGLGAYTLASDRLRAGAIDVIAYRLAHRPGRRHGRGRDVRQSHRARPVRARKQARASCPRASPAWASSHAYARRWAACCPMSWAGVTRFRRSAVFGALSLAVVALRFQETLAARNPLALRPASLLATWLSILRHPTFLTYSALSTASYAGLFTFLATSSFVFIKVLGLSRTEYGLLMFSMAFVYILGTFMCRRLLPRYGVRRSVAIAGALTLAGGTLMGGLAWAGLHNGWAIMLPFYLFMLAHGVHQPCGQSGAVGPVPASRGRRVSAQRLPDDGRGVCRRRLGRNAAGWNGLRSHQWHVVLERVHCRGVVDPGAMVWRTTPGLKR